MNSDLPALRSVRSDLMSAVTFISRTRRPVAIYWMNYEGQRVRYCVINYGDHFPLTTYESHPWIFRDSNNGDKLVTSDGQEVFWPRPWDGGQQDRVIIGIPVYTLREKCLQVVRSLFTTEVIGDLSIPMTLKDDLLKGLDATPFSVCVDL